MKILHLSDLKLVEKSKPEGYIQDIISNCVENIDDEIFVLDDKVYRNLCIKYKKNEGVGFELKNFLKSVGIKIEEDSFIDKKFTDINNLGADWCELNTKIILYWLEIEAKQRKIPFIRIVGKMLLSKAIKIAKGKKI
jgi:hypothetical protein